jgi:hypothetical protein
MEFHVTTFLSGILSNTFLASFKIPHFLYASSRLLQTNTHLSNSIFITSLWTPLHFENIRYHKIISQNRSIYHLQRPIKASLWKLILKFKPIIAAQETRSLHHRYRMYKGYINGAYLDIIQGWFQWKKRKALGQGGRTRSCNWIERDTKELPRSSRIINSSSLLGICYAYFQLSFISNAFFCYKAHGVKKQRK